MFYVLTLTKLMVVVVFPSVSLLRACSDVGFSIQDVQLAAPGLLMDPSGQGILYVPPGQ